MCGDDTQNMQSLFSEYLVFILLDYCKNKKAPCLEIS